MSGGGSSEDLPGVNMTAMIDIVFQLVIFFIFTVKMEEGIMSEKQNDATKLIVKMRTNTEKQNRNTVAIPARRIRKKVQKTRHTQGSKKQR